MCQYARKIIAKNLIKYRLQMKYTREELSLKIEKDNSYISKLEKSKINIPIDTLERLAKELKVSIKDFFI